MAFVLAILTALSGCSRTAGSAPADGTLTIAQIQEPRSLNPLFLDGYVTGEINGLVYSYLTVYDTRGEMIPQVAAAVPTVRNGGISRDGLHMTYHLRRDVHWQDGAPLTARDVVFTFNAVMNPRNNTLSRYGYDLISSVRAPNAYEVRLTLKKPVASMVSYFFGGDSNYGILPAHLLRRYASLNEVPFNAAPVGSGPYRVVEWQRGDHMTFVANSTYFLGKPAIPRIVIKFVPDAQTIINELRTGEVNEVFLADVSHIDELRAIAQHQLVESATTQFGTLQVNTTDPVTGEVSVRRALALSIDRQALTKKIFKGVYDPNTAMQGLFTWAFDPSAGTVPYDPARARRVLEADGWRLQPDGVRVKNGKRLDVSLLGISGSAASNSLVTQISAYAAAVGIRLHVRTLTPFLITSPSGPLYQGKFQVAQFTEMSQADPDATWIIGCDQRAPHGFNFTRYCDPHTQALLDDGASTFDRARRLRDYAQVQSRLIAEQPMIFLYQVKEVDVVPKWLSGYTPSMYTSPYTFVYKWRIAPRKT
ncbi:MAG TPA: peptide ABC transporter substrate-binding protein [Candidatus Baltobacteraceae bacterium]